MAVKLGNGNWAVKEDKLLAYNDNSGRFFNKEFDFARGSIATYVGKDGLIKSAASDVPRIDFSDSTNGALLLEPQSTNLFTYSNDFSQWDSLGASVINNALVSPDGTLNADELVFDGTNNGRIEETVPTTNGIPYTFSVWLKNNDLSDATKVWIGLSTTTQGEYVTVTNVWKRFVITSTSNGTLEYPRVQTSEVGSIFAYGAQLEALSYATSYIPTSGSAVTRVRDACNNSGSAQDFNSEEGVLYAEIAILANDGTIRYLGLNDGSSGNRAILLFDSNANRIRGIVSSGGTKYVDVNHQLTNALEFHKVAMKYKLNDFALWIDGVEVATDTTLNAPIGLDRLDFSFSAANNFYGKTKNLKVFTTALTDEQLAALTTI